MVPTFLALVAITATRPMAPAPRTTVEPLHRLIDQQIVRGYPQSTHSAGSATDEEFLRRVWLDLNGTLPAAAEVREFLADSSPKKREQWIDRLLARPDYARRLMQFFDVTYMERRPDAKVPHAAWEEYLRTSFASNKPYDQLVREILSADGVDKANRAPAKFLLDRELQPDPVTRDIGRVFLGRDMQCAQCHDHPLVKDYLQEHYFGIQAYFNRSFLFPAATDANAVIADKAEGDVTFVSVFDKSKTVKGTTPHMPGQKPAVEPKFEKGKEYKVAPAKGVRPVPVFSRREQLAKSLTDQRMFARTAVNRLWSLMFGRGIVDPVDMDHSGNPASHPELLDLLTERFIQSGYDVKSLLREIALSETYQLSSEIPTALTDVPADRYLVAPLKPLAPEQLAYALLQATGQTDIERAAVAKSKTPLALDQRLAGSALGLRKAFSGAPGQPESYSATLDQSLFVKHGPSLRNLISARNGNLADRLAKISDHNAMADELFMSVLCRPASADEKKDVAEMMAATRDPVVARAELIWSLIASTEFRFNH